jgi:hypothetical protein
MKHQGLILTLLAPLLVAPQRALAQSLGDIWNFSAPALRDPKLDPNGLRINIHYNVSDFIMPDMVAYSVKDWDCIESVEEWFLPSVISPAANHVQGDGSGKGVIEIEINVDPDSFEDAGDDKASFWQQDGQDRYQVRFCLYAGVQTVETEPTVIDYSETQITITYDLSDGFVIGFEVAPVKNEEIVDDAYGIDGYLCGADGIKLTDDEVLMLGASPGSELIVCVTPDQRSLESGAFQLDQIDIFEWIRVDSNGMEFKQLAVRDGVAAGDGLTVLECDDDGLKCQFATILRANFFQGALPTPSPTAELPPPPSGFIVVGQGFCTDNAGNKFDFYEQSGTVLQCPGQCQTLAGYLQVYPEEVRAFEHDGVRCRCLVDGGYG